MAGCQSALLPPVESLVTFMAAQLRSHLRRTVPSGSKGPADHLACHHDRLLKPVRIQYKKRGRATTKPGTLLRKQIPLKTNQWDETRPGFVEADTVAHCGDTMAGMFAFTVDCVDIATGWTEQRAVWGKGESGVLEQIRDIEQSLPFPLLGFDCDNGSEFLNYHLLRHFTERKKPIQFTRSRAYHKDDNAHIEQKNWTHVRQWLGYDRLDNPQVVPFLTTSIPRNGACFITSSCLRSNCWPKKELLLKPSGAMILRKPLTSGLWNPLW